MGYGGVLKYMSRTLDFCTRLLTIRRARTGPLGETGAHPSQALQSPSTSSPGNHRKLHNEKCQETIGQCLIRHWPILLDAIMLGFLYLSSTLLAFLFLSFGLPPASACSFRTCLLSKGTAVPAPPGAAAPWVRPGPPAPQSTPVRNYCVWAGIAYTLLLGLGLSQATPSIQVALLEGLLQGFSSSPSRRATPRVQVALLQALHPSFETPFEKPFFPPSRRSIC